MSFQNARAATADTINGIFAKITASFTAITLSSFSEAGLSDEISALNSILSGLSITPNSANVPAESGPYNGPVDSNFSALTTGGGPKIDTTLNGGTEITNDGVFIVQSKDALISFLVSSTNGTGIVAQGSESGIFANGKTIGLWSEGKNIGVYAEGVSSGIEFGGQPSIGIEAASSSGIGILSVGETTGIVSDGAKSGIAGTSQSGAGVVGYNLPNGLWAALGYKNGSSSYGLYSNGLTQIDKDLSSDGTIDSYQTNVLSTTNVLTSSDIVSLLTPNWYNSKGTDVLWNASNVSVNQSLYGIGATDSNLLVNTSKGSGNNLIIEKGGLSIGTGIIDGKGQKFIISSDLDVSGSSSDLHSTGKITSNKEIGRFYFRENVGTTNPMTVSCDSGDWLVGCSGQITEGEDIITKSTPSSTTEPLNATCTTQRANLASSTMAVYAYCFDPQGTATTLSSVSSIPDRDVGGGDGFPDFQDNCPTRANSTQADGDKDAYGDSCDNCSSISNSDQKNSDSDSYGDACDCRSTDSSSYPGAGEDCGDGVDNDCDGSVDEGCDTTGPTGSILINGGAVATKETEVDLSISATDPSGVAFMCLGNTSDISIECDTVWGNYQTTVTNWLLSSPSTDGVKNVYIWFKDYLSNQSSYYSDSIILDRVAPDGNLLLDGIGSPADIRLKWSFTDPSPASGIDYYILTGSTSGYGSKQCPSGEAGITRVPNLTTTQYTWGGHNDEYYYFRLCAVDKAGNISDGAFTGVYVPPIAP